jgi:hypothetical protein
MLLRVELEQDYVHLHARGGLSIAREQLRETLDMSFLAT